MFNYATTPKEGKAFVLLNNERLAGWGPIQTSRSVLSHIQTHISLYDGRGFVTEIQHRYAPLLENDRVFARVYLGSSIRVANYGNSKAHRVALFNSKAWQTMDLDNIPHFRQDYTARRSRTVLSEDLTVIESESEKVLSIW